MLNESLWAALTLVLSLIIAGPALAAEDIVFYLEDEPIYTTNSQENSGFLIEVVMEMTKVMGLKPKVQFLPWKRAQLMTIATPNAVIFPLTRTPSREPNYRWICKVFDVPVMFINKQGKALIDSPKQARQIRGIGVILGTPQEEQLKAFGVPYVTFSGKQLFPALADNRVAAIFTAQPEAVLGWRKAGYSDRLQFGKTLQVLPLWIATNKDSDKVRDDEWIRALNTIKESGFFNRMLKKYFDIEPSDYSLSGSSLRDPA